jgi:hypothetical protein
LIRLTSLLHYKCRNLSNQYSGNLKRNDYCFIAIFSACATTHSTKPNILCLKRKSKANPVTDHEGPYSCGMLRLPHFLKERLRYASEVVILTHWSPFTPKEATWYSFLL